MFFSFDGIDGAGKSTQMKLFVEWLAARGQEVLTCIDPGSTELGNRVRAILLGKHDYAISMTSEMLLFMAARAQLVEEVIRPALAAGKTVVSDRYLLANVVYQAHAGGLDVDTLWHVGKVATGGLEPDCTFVLDLPVEAAEARLAQTPDRAADRLESRDRIYRQKLRNGFLLEASRRPNVHVIDATKSPAAVHQQILLVAAPYVMA